MVGAVRYPPAGEPDEIGEATVRGKAKHQIGADVTGVLRLAAIGPGLAHRVGILGIRRFRFSESIARHILGRFGDNCDTQQAVRSG